MHHINVGSGKAGAPQHNMYSDPQAHRRLRKDALVANGLGLVNHTAPATRHGESARSCGCAHDAHSNARNV
jgi:hypothetical protein